MKKVHSLGDRLIALVLSIIMVVGMLPLQANANGSAVAKIGDVTYNSLADALAAVPTGTNKELPAEVTTITLLQDAAYAFDVGTSTGSKTMNLKLDLGGNKLTLSPSVGSAGTKSNGIRVLAYSKLEIANGSVVCSDKTEDNVKVGIANYSELILDGVEVQGGALTTYTINNRGKLTLKGKTSVTGGSTCSVTNDPYNLYYSENVDASINCDSSEVVVESVLVERYARESENKGGVALNISAGYFGHVNEDGNTGVATSYNVTGGTIGVSTTKELELAVKMAKAGAPYSCPANPVTIKLLNDLSGSFDVGTSTGKAPKNILLDLNGKTLTLKPGVGSFNTKSNGIRVLAYSKLEVKNGTLLCSGETEDNIRVGIANYGDLTLDDVNAQSGALTIYTINNRGKLTLKGETTVENGKVAQTDYTDSAEYVAITNDPYNMYYQTPIDAELNCEDSDVSVGNIQLETYGSQGDIALNIKDGNFGGIYEPADQKDEVEVKGNITGGSFKGADTDPAVDIGKYCKEGFNAVLVDGKITVKYAQSGFGFENTTPEVTYGDNGNKFTNAVKNAVGTVKYAIVSAKNASGNDAIVAEINEDTGELAIKMAGTVTVKATADGGTTHNPAEATYTLKIKHANQGAFKFANISAEITYNDADPIVVNGEKNKYTLITENSKTNDVTYSIVSGDCAILNNGVLTINKAGTIVIKAVSNGDDKYNASEESTFTLTVKKDAHDFSFNDATIYYGTKEYENPITYGENCGKATVTYSVSGNNIGASITEANKNNGKITFGESTGKVGTITVTAVMAADDCYEETTKTYNLTVKYLETPTEKPIVSTPNGENGWHTETVKISAPAGYTISYNNSLADDDWKAFVEHKEDTEAKDVQVFLKNADGHITDAIDIPTFKLDQVDPTIKVEYEKDPVWKSIAKKIGIYKNDTDKIHVVITVEDKTSGLASVTYNVGSSVQTINYNNGEKKAEIEFDIAPEYRHAITVTAKDKSGRTTIKNDELTLVLDKKAPELLQTVYGFENDKYREYNNIFYTQGKTTVKFTIDEANFDLNGLSGKDGNNNDSTLPVPVFTVNGDEKTLTWTQIEENGQKTTKWTAVHTLEGDGDYKLSLTYTDPSTNEMTSYAQEIRIDSTKPVISLDKDGVYYNGADRTVPLQITEHNFKADEVVLTVTATDINGNPIALTGKTYSDYANDPDNWVPNGDVHTLKTEGMKFDIEGIYTVTVTYKDLAGNESTEDANLVLDKTAPAGDKIKIEYSDPIGNVVGKLLGLYKDEVVVTVAAEDHISGVKAFELTYTRADDVSATNKDTYTVMLAPNQDAGNKGVFTAAHTIPASARGTVSVKVIDNSENNTTKDGDKTLVVDKTAPKLTDVIYGFTDDQKRLESGVYYTQGDTTVKFVIDEANFDLRGLDITDPAGNPGKTAVPVITVNGTTQDLPWQQIAENGAKTDKWFAELPLSGDGDYLVRLTYTDPSTNEMISYAQEIRIDSVKPVISLDKDGVYYNGADRTVPLQITEHNFKADEVELTVTATDINGNAINLQGKSYTADAKTSGNWTPDGDVWTLDPAMMNFDVEGIYTVTVTYKDLAENESTAKTEFIVDKTAPDADKIKIEYSKPAIYSFLENFGFYTKDVVVTVTAEDLVAGVNVIELTYNQADGDNESNKATYTVVLTPKQDAEKKDVFTASHTIPADARGTVSVKVIDNSANNTSKADGMVLVVDQIAPNREVIYTPHKVLDAKTMLDVANNAYAEGDNAILYYTKDAKVTFKITEANFDLTLKDDSAKPVIKVNGEPVTVEWQKTEKTDEWVATYTLTCDKGACADYTVSMSYKDLSSNKMVQYSSCKIAIDEQAPELSVSYSDGESLQKKGYFYDSDQKITLKIAEHNFRADDVVLTVNAVDINGNAVDVSDKDYSAYAKNRKNWTSDGDVHTLKTKGMKFDKDAIYTISVSYADICDHTDTYERTFVVDKTTPVDLKVEYQSADSQILNNIFKTITFGNYQAEQLVVLTMTDMTAGIDYIKVTAEAAGPETATDVEMPELEIWADGTVKGGTAGFINKKKITSSFDSGVLTITFPIPEQFRGKLNFTAYDKSANSASDSDDRVMVVDTIAPDRTITYEPTAIVKNKTLKNTKTLKESSKVTMYYNTDAVATIKVVEANFYSKDIVVKVNGEVVSLDGKWKEGEKDNEWTNTLTLKDEGDYVITMEYMDRSSNKMVKYKSQKIVIDKTAPVIKVKYSNTDVKNTFDGRDYFDKKQTATITIKEHNFRADDVKISVTAKNVVGKDVLTMTKDGSVVKSYAETGADRDEWTAYEEGTWRREDDTYVLTLTFKQDANYTFDIEYADLATNKAKDFTEDLFTVDKTAPKKLSVKYSTSVFQQILESITFGFYNAKMTVTISAEDATSGIYRFKYSYINNADVSKVNAELLDQAIKEAKITYDGKKATAKFSVPKLALGDNNQFNGTVAFTAYDRSKLSTKLKDSTVIIVDNISPTAEITYNAPVQTVDGTSFYAGDIDATIVINEANFDSADVKVNVTKNGEAFPVSVSWADDSVDMHTGTFTLSEDGDYIVSVQYKDKSGNAMSAYTSNELTLDATSPTITVSNIKANSANKDETYGFVIQIHDTNLDAAAMKPVLKTVVKDESGAYVIKEIDLGAAATVVSGQTYSYTVENLPDDGLYTLTCDAKDMAANAMSQITLEDGVSYEQVQFSINRDGSAFGYGNTFTEDLVGQYYVYSVNEDVVIVEVNVDPIETYKVTLNGEELQEETHYTTTQTSNPGEWSKRTYTIKKDLFAAEGEYNIVVSSTDKAETTAFSDVKNLSMAFVVDQTEPVVIVAGLTNNGRYQTESQTVTLIPTDDGGRLNELTVIVTDSDGNPIVDDRGNDISVLFSMSGMDLLEHLEKNEGKVEVVVPEGLNHQVKILCADSATKTENVTNANEQTFSRVTVSPSGLVIFYANTSLFVGSIVAVLGIVALIIFLIKRKKNKK